MSWNSIDNQAFRADAKKALTRMAEIMEHPAVTEQLGLAYTWSDTDRIDDAVQALDKLSKPDTFIDRIMNERAMETVEKGLYASSAMLNRNGFQDVKGVAWDGADQKLVEDTLKDYERIMVHHRN